MVYTELISAEALIRNNKKTFKLMEIFPDEVPVAIQIFGNNPEAIARGAAIAAESKPALIDINMGCCAQKVCSSGSGAALLKSPETVYKTAHMTVAASPLPVTAKIRIGWDMDRLNYLEVVDALEKGGIKAITVHGRTRAQQYSGKADWDIIEEIAGHATVPVIGNGDITTHDEAIAKLETSACHAVMIGRAALGNPWIFSGKEPTLEQRVETVKRHILDMIDYYGEYGLILSRKHTVKYFHQIRNASNIRKHLVTSESLSDTLSLLDSLCK